MANSKRRCKQCGEFHPAESGVKTPGGWFCGMAHAIEFAREKSQRLADRKAKQASQESAKAHKARVMEVKPLSYWMKRAQAAFNAWVRERDKDQPCISCGRHHQGQYHAGHYMPTSSHPELRFEQSNCNKQCAPCNLFLSGSLTSYRVALIEKIGIEKVEWLEGPHEPKRYRKEDYQAIEAEYKQKIKELKSGN